MRTKWPAMVSLWKRSIKPLPFTTRDGAATDLGTLGGTFSEGYAINSSGQVTGYSQTSGGDSHAFLTTSTGTLTDGTAVDIGTLGGGNSQGLAVNSAGQVVGYSNTNTGDNHAFVYTESLIDLNSMLSLGNQAN